MQTHGKILLAIGVIGTFMILALTAWGGGNDGDGTVDPPASTIESTAAPTLEVLAATATPLPTATPEPAPALPLNRLSCPEIRGTDYLSGEERTWFIANC